MIFLLLLQVGLGLCFVLVFYILESEHGNSCSLGRGSDISRGNSKNTGSYMFAYIGIYL